MSAALVCALSLSAAARAETFAVLAVDADANPAGQATRAASAVRDALKAQSVAVLTVDETRARIAQSRGVTGYDVAGIKKRIDKAEEANAALDPQTSITILQAVVDDLAHDLDFTAEKQKLLEDGRLRLATRLVAVAGSKETGVGETPEGKRAAAALLEALRVNPTLTLDEARFSPKMRRLAQSATEAQKKLGLGALTVTSRPAGARVFLEGRDIGVTPLRIGAVIPRGQYRVWAELGGTRGAIRMINVGETTPAVDIDLQFEGALWAQGPGLKPLAGTTIDEDVAKKVGRFVDVDKLLLVGISHYDDAEWVYAASFSVRTSSISRRGAVRVDNETDLAAAATELAAFLSTGASSASVQDAPVPAQVLPTGKTEVVRASDGSVTVVEAGQAEQPPEVEDAPLPWIAIGVGAGVAALVVAAGVTAAVLVSSAPREGLVTGSVEVLE